MRELIRKCNFYTLFRSDEGFIAELDTAALSGIPDLTNIELSGTNELVLTLRAARVVNETINPTDVITRRIVAIQRPLHQQEIFVN